MAQAKRKRKATDATASAELAARQAAGAGGPPGGHGSPTPAAGDGQGAASENKKYKKRAALYLRVSTTKQSVENQERELREVAARADWEIVRIYKDEGISGSKSRDRRPALDAMLHAMVRREFDIVLSWSVDRLGRSLQDLVATLNEMRSVGCDLFILKQNLDTTTPSGRLMFQMVGAFAEFERAIIIDRVNAGLDVARSKGKRLGKPPVPEKVKQQIRDELAKGTGILKVGRMFSVGTPTVQQIKKEMAA